VSNCAAPHFVVGPWSPCSAACTSGFGLATVAGVTRRRVQCAVGDVTVNASTCEAVGVPVPAAVAKCNRFPCPSHSFALSIGPWSPCTPVAGSCAVTNTRDDGTSQRMLPGLRRRSLTCVQTNGSGVAVDVGDLSPCLSLAASLPATQEQCAAPPALADAAPPCACAVGSGQAQNPDRDACEAPYTTCAIDAAGTGGGVVAGAGTGPATGTGRCVCAPGFGGDGCRVEQQRVSPPACVDGVVDSNGACCRGAIDARTGACCRGDDAVLDTDGRCCVAAVDACGVCGGTAVAVDVRGVCCASALPPSGQCCSHTVDECGE
jgi:hypothetical protein